MRGKSNDLTEAIITNVPASPLSSNKPNFFNASLIKLAQDYLQDRNISHLGHALKIMRPIAGQIAKANGINTYNEMIATDPEIRKNVSMLYLASISNNTAFSAPKTFTSRQEQRYADNAVAFMDEVKTQMELPIDKERRKIVYDVIRYGNGIGEISYTTGYGRLKNKLAIKGIRGVDIRTCVFITDAFNRITGYAPYGFPGVMAPLDTWVSAEGFVSMLFDHFEHQRDRVDYAISTQLLPKHKVLHLQWLPCTDEPRGQALLDAAFQPWWAKQQIMPILLYFIENWGVTRRYSALAEKAEDVKLYNADGTEYMVDSIPQTEPPLTAMQRELDSWGAGGSLTVPYGYTINKLEASAGMGDLMLKALDFFNREISSAISNQFLTASQGQKSGGEKGVESHKDVLSLMILHLKEIQSGDIKTQFCEPLIGANFGKAAKRYAPGLDLGDSDGFPVSLDEVGFLAQSMPGFFTQEMYPGIGRKVGIQYIPTKNRVTMPKSAANDVTAIQAVLQSQLGCSQGTFSIDFTDDKKSA